MSKSFKGKHLSITIDLWSLFIRSVLTATISCLTVIVKKRPQYLKSVMNAFKSWRKTKTKDDSPVMLRNVEKALKLAFVSLIR
jgi:symplekin